MVPATRLRFGLVLAALCLLAFQAPVIHGSAESQWRDALKIGKAAASRPKFTDEDEGRMAQARRRSSTPPTRCGPNRCSRPT